MSGKYTYSTTNYTAQEYKDIGNKSFNQRKYNEAISYYSKAIVSISIIIDPKNG